MLKRMVWVGKRAALPRAAVASARKKDTQIVAVARGAQVPAGAAAVLAAAGNATAALTAALAVAAWNEDLLKLLAEAIDCREGMTPGSSARVMDHAQRFGAALGLSADDRFTLERGALLRDIGKIRIPNDVLLKPGVLTYDEWRLLRQHPHYGADIASQVGALTDIIEIVRYHHECYDGDGYPDGLEGEQIPYLARVTKILDVYCAMTSPRHYRAGHMSHKAAVEHLRDETGKHFDARLVEIFITADVGRTDAERGNRGKGEKGKRHRSA